MNIRRFIPTVRATAFVLIGLTAGYFIATGMAALAFGYVPPPVLRMSSTFVAYAGLLAVVALLLIDRRKRDRPRQQGVA